MFRLISLATLLMVTGISTGCITCIRENVEDEENFVSRKVTSSVRIVTEPSGAKLYMDDKYVGTTPRVLDLEHTKIEGDRIKIDIYDVYGTPYNKPTGHRERRNKRRIGKYEKWVEETHKITIYLDGYEKQEITITVPTEKRRLVFLNAIAPKVTVSQQQQQQQTVVIPGAGGQTDKLGSINLTSVPENCEIHIDGAYVGNTPATLKLPKGMHEIEVKAKGFKAWKRTIRVLAESTAQLKAELEKEE